MEKITDVQESKHQKGDPSFEKSIKHYSNSHQILLVGEGDFSFSLVVANAFGSAKNMVSTSRDDRGIVLSSYKRAYTTLLKLESLGATILHGVDATKLEKHHIIGKRSFDRIVYNFPHAGFYGPETNKAVIKRHRRLMKDFFKSASTVLSTEGEIHVTHRSDHPYNKWKLEKQAKKHGLLLKKSDPFDSKDYPGYVNRRGAGCRAGARFYLRNCLTYRFILSPDILERRKLMAEAGVSSDSLSECLMQLKSEREAREAAEKAKADLESSLNDSKIADGNSKKSAEPTGQRTYAAGPLAQAGRGKENIDNTNLKRTPNLRADNNTSQRIDAGRHKAEALKSKKEEINRKETDDELKKQINELKKQTDELKKKNDELKKKNDELKKQNDEVLYQKEESTKQFGEALEVIQRTAKECLERLTGTSLKIAKEDS